MFSKCNRKTGVYCIRNLKNGKRYIGSAAQDLLYRWQIHRSNLRAGRHVNVYLQRAWQKHGEEAFVFEVLECCPPGRCVAQEQFWIDQYDSANPRRGYNRNPTAGSMLGFRHTEASKQKISQVGKGRKHTDEAKRKISAKMSDVMKGNKHFAGKTQTVATRRKIAEAVRKQWQDEDHRQDIAVKNRRNAVEQWQNPEYRERHRQAMIAWAARRRNSQKTEGERLSSPASG